MRTQRYDDDAVPSRALHNRLYKLELATTHAIHCGYCRYHRGENQTHRSPNADPRKRHVKWKNGRGYSNNAGSFNGRTAPFGGVDAGSNPAPVANDMDV